MLYFFLGFDGKPIPVLWPFSQTPTFLVRCARCVQDTGMRPQDVFRMKWEHVNWFKKVLFVPYGKTRNSRRWVSLSERVLEALKQRGIHPSGWVFPSPYSQSGHITNVAKQWIATRNAIGLDASVKLYCCRHTFARDALARTGNLAALMKALGHADAQTAMKYQHPGSGTNT
jgi:integrase